MQNFEAFKELLGSPKRIAIITHPKPDADALGSSLGLAGYLKKKSHTVQVITPTDYPKFLQWMDGNEGVINFEAEGNAAKAEKIFQDADVIFCLDFPSLSRIGEIGEIVRRSPAKKVLIDHHLEPELFADYTLSKTSAAATCQLIYELITDLGDVDKIDLSIAECLYAGIMTDTGSFRHSNTTKDVHLVCAALIDKGVEISKVNRLIYDTNTEERMRFLGFALKDKLVVLPEYRIAYFAISADELDKYHSQTGDTEGLVNYGLSIDNIVFSALFTEREGMIRISFRSVGNFSVNEFSRKYFNGGGHKNAAGGRSLVSLNDTIQKFLDVVPQYKQELFISDK
ncbi:bifunctional oligoribonuclease/PAP phosphatase NrnA [Cytophagaceae bacterium DM2B3-1]|uniref:Bifunctional oligoribonuclease/PAP phosphatase NrnA n=1 Tax=Xanthocytophaga flava TaxID=3048013 RepID=A0ABT7CPT5_9BACT|nr:bifunctional oligoribonuclease/PAP phosphatase NrnA [Xanthocytophaga flavus]MDJ1471249.1 bifunctional oligoribonuclease/PAP phosphatase NrnA [Xanthocytophaga flavus]MDJ1495752.1 bifunctional oligoribonuclease/PAP phosphatase NrnA [Xanthocytophaga flavus]